MHKDNNKQACGRSQQDKVKHIDIGIVVLGAAAVVGAAIMLAAMEWRIIDG
jgi:hypothetical protein